ncbi:MAG: HEAT repeat domain-containing protein [Bacteroidota bacterium]
MSTNNIQELIQKYHQGILSESEELALEQHIEAGTIEVEQLSDLKVLSQRLDQAFDVDPSPALRQAFYEQLAKEKAHLPKPKESQWSRLWDRFWVQRLAYSLVLLAIGFGAGYFLQSNKGYKDQLANMSGELTEMREMMMLGLLDKESASERLRAVSLTQEMPEVSQQVAEALLKTLNNDENVNVRLSTLEALFPYANDPKVREGLIRSIPQQDSPLVQMALAEMMVALQEKGSIEGLRDLLNREETPKEAKEKIQHSIEILL